jgi:hypothetical protein
VEKNSIDFLARVIREACLRVQGNLETAVEFLPCPRRPGLSLDHWLRPGPAKTDHFFAGVNSQPPSRAFLGLRTFFLSVSAATRDSRHRFRYGHSDGASDFPGKWQ